MDIDTQGYAIKQAVEGKPDMPSLDDWPGGKLFINGQQAFLLGVKVADRRPLAVNVLVLGYEPPSGRPQIEGRHELVASRHAVLLRGATDEERAAQQNGGENTGLATIEYLAFLERTREGLSFLTTGEAHTYVVM